MTKLTSSKKLQLINTLDGNARQIELTPAQREHLERAYNNVAKWLASSEEPLLKNIQIYPQGSVRLQTTVRPLGQDEFDVDLVCFLPDAHPYWQSADDIYQLIGQRLKEHGAYKKMLKPKNRCWRLDYADGSKFHMDITPAMPNPNCILNGILVPDRERQELKPSNPVKYSEIFDGISKLAPEFKELGVSMFAEALAKASIEPLPDPMESKDLLRRIVQISKRHRDLYFQHARGHPPISVILTTLAMESYAALTKQTFQNPWDFMLSVIQEMPLYVRHTMRGFEVPNPSAPGENFAEKWNDDPAKAADFHSWHAQFVQDISALADAEGLDQIQPILEKKLIGLDSLEWQKRMINQVGIARKDNRLYRASGVGGISLAGGIPVQKNTFFGD